MRSTKRKNKKILAVIIFSLLLVFLVTAGTIAWLTRTSSLVNTFTIGAIEIPTTAPDDSPIEIDGNLYEPSWDSETTHKLIPSATFDKDPYVGIGAGSEDVAVYVYVENNFSNKVYFDINTGWEAVEATVGYNDPSEAANDARYTSGLFKYTAGLSGATTSDVWTEAPLFSSVVVDETAELSDFTVAEGKNSEIKISCFLHQANDNDGQAIPEDSIEAAAKEALIN